MGLLSSLLCCSTDSKDDGNDKIQNQKLSPHQQQQQQQKQQGEGQRKPRQQQGQKRVAENENSDNNDSKSIDNKIRNDNSDDTKSSKIKQVNGSKSDDIEEEDDNETKLELSKKNSFEINHEGNSINETEESPNHTPKSSTLNNNNNQNNPGDLITQVNENKNPDKSLESDDEEDDDDEEEEDLESYLDLTKLQDGQAHDSESGCLLGFKSEKFGSKKCLILDLDETLVHSSFKYIRSADFVIPVEIDGQVHHVYVIKRPGVDEFLQKVGQWYEVVVFTASVQKYGDPLLDKLDLNKSVHHRLFRDSCYNYQGNFIKNLAQMGRDVSKTIIIDNSPTSYIFHPQNSIPISSWFSDSHDNELLDLLPFLQDLSKPTVDNVEIVLDISY
ncbi:unnamed protein product [Candida verbasci]|uniref:FCP1 homology domain-containing protein n=1 Tax=Candida verbasci TaxID=1227364 RepID=A0A9W4TVJ8_9ASCO|nr:unnamed protein product [Candida verbasci]